MLRQNKKRRPKAPLFEPDIGRSLRCFRRSLLLHWTGIEALGIDIAVDELDDRHRRVVAIAEAGLDDAGVTAVAVLVAGSENFEQLLGLVDIAHLRDRLAAQRKSALLAERDELLHDRAQFLGLRQR